MMNASQTSAIKTVHVLRSCARKATLTMQPATHASPATSFGAGQNLQDVNLKVSQYA